MSDKMGFNAVYPFATENVGGYFKKLNLEGKDILTVGSSMDQLLNSVVFGADKVTVLDINPYCEEYFQMKKKKIFECKREQFFDNIMNMNNGDFFSKDVLFREKVYFVNEYLKNDNMYELLREKINKLDIQFVTGDVFKMNELGLDKTYDCMILSNVLQSMEYVYKDKRELFLQLRNSFSIWDSYLKDGGILQLLYLYSYGIEDLYCLRHGIATYCLRDVYQALCSYSLDIFWIEGIVDGKNDAVVTYTKRLKK